MAYKSKKQREEEKQREEAAMPSVPVDVFESKAFAEAFANYRKSVGSMPKLLEGILREAVAVRILLEGKV